jgi:hypothetical protein
MKPEQRKKNFQLAARHIQAAVDALRKIEDDMQDKYSNDACHFRCELSELLSCDHGEAGLLPMIERMK